MDSPAAIPIVNGLDIGIGVLLLISAVFAYVRGLAQEVLSVAGWIGATFASVYGFPYLKPFARQLIGIDIVADFGAGIVIFVVSLVLLSLFTRRISKMVKDSALGAVDRSLGFLFGLARGVLIVVVAYIGLGMVYPEDEQPQWIHQARSVELIAPGATWLAALIPENLSVITGADDKATDGKDAKRAEQPAGKRRVIQDLMAPRPKSGENEEPEGYGKKERQQMERLNEIVKDR